MSVRGEQSGYTRLRVCAAPLHVVGEGESAWGDREEVELVLKSSGSDVLSFQEIRGIVDPRMWGVERGGPDACGSASPGDAGECLFLFHKMTIRNVY